MQISINSTTIFRGIIEKKQRTEDKRLKISGRDYYLKFVGKYAQLKSYTNQTASQILIDIINSYFSDLTTNSIQSTSNQYTREYRLTNINQIIMELNRSEGYVTYIDTSKDVHFEPETYTDSGKHYTASQILSVNHEEKSNEIINQVLVVYGQNLDKAIERRNDDSIAIYGIREKVETKSNIATEADAIDYADSILSSAAFPINPVEVTVRLDETLQVGSIIWMPIDPSGISEQPYLILEAEHNLAPPYTKLKLGIYISDTVNAISEIIRKLRNIEEDKISASVTFTAVNDVLAEITVSGTITVKRRTIDGMKWGEFTWGQKRWGQVSGAYTTLINASTAILTNKGIETLLRIIFQLATVPNLFDSANSHIAIGSGSAQAKITDLSLQSEVSRLQVNPGSPRANGDGKLVWEATFDDGELVTGTITELGLLNANSAGDLLLKYSGNGISKAANEELEVSFELTLTGLTSAALNLLRDLVAGFDINYLDATNASIEITDGTTPYRELANSLQFTNTNYDEVLVEIRVTNPAEVSTGYQIQAIKLYNKTSGGTEITNASVNIVTEASKDNVIRQKIKMKRG